MTNDIQLWVDDPEWAGLVPPDVRQAVRKQTMEGYLQLAKVLEPYATGVMGEISPKMVELYMGALRQFALLGGAYNHPPAREPAKKEEVVESTAVDGRVLGARVLRQLDEMEQEMREGRR